MTLVLEIDRRREFSTKKLDSLRGTLAVSKKLCASKACVYVTGSFGRLDASSFSDVDCFIVGKAGERKHNDIVRGSKLNRLDEICVKADLIQAVRAQRIKEFDGDGRYLNHYSIDAFMKSLGRPQDDMNNTFTARLLMLLESRCLVEKDVYDDIIAEILASYFIDYEQNAEEFVPAFLSNDIMRLWRTFCVNYEANTQNDTETTKAKRRLKNYKLKHSRLLTCYSALIFLLYRFKAQNETVHPADAVEMASLTPLERLGAVAEKDGAEVEKFVGELTEHYEQFLNVTNASEADLITRFADKDEVAELRRNARLLGDKVFYLMRAVGRDNRFHRLLVV